MGDQKILDEKYVDNVSSSQIEDIFQNLHSGWSFLHITLGTGNVLLYICSEPAYKDDRVFVGYTPNLAFSIQHIKFVLTDTLVHIQGSMEAKMDYLLADIRIPDEPEWREWYIDFSDTADNRAKCHQNDVPIRFTVTREIALDVALYFHKHKAIPKNYLWIETDRIKT